MAPTRTVRERRLVVSLTPTSLGGTLARIPSLVPKPVVPIVAVVSFVFTVVGTVNNVPPTDPILEWDPTPYLWR